MSTYLLCRQGPHGKEVLAEWTPTRDGEVLTISPQPWPVYLEEQRALLSVPAQAKVMQDRHDDWVAARPDWGHGPKPPVPMFTEAEIRECLDGIDPLTVDDFIDKLKENRREHAPPLG